MVGTRKLAVLFLLSMLLFSFVVPSALADPAEPVGPFKLIQAATQKVAELGTFNFLEPKGTKAALKDSQFIGFTRVMYIILAFAILYGGLSVIPGIGQMQNVTIPISGILAVIVALGTPKNLLLVFLTTYASFFGFLFLGAPIFGTLALLFGTPTNNAWQAFGKAAMVVVIILIVLGSHTALMRYA